MAKKETIESTLGPIETAKSKGRLPVSGTPVQIKDKLGSTNGMLIKQEYLEVRSPGAKGTYEGIVAGHGGDVWWIKHEGGSIGAYTFEELTDVKQEDATQN